jgi:hypothetical protein
MICLICGKPIGQEQPVPVAEIRFTPIVPYVPGITKSVLGETVLKDRLCCQGCYKSIQENDFKAIEEAGHISRK